MSWKQQQAAKRHAALALEALHTAEIVAEERLERTWKLQRDKVEWAQRVRAEARAALAEMEPDPDAEQHAAEAYRAVYGR